MYTSVLKQSAPLNQLRQIMMEQKLMIIIGLEAGNA
jgi:hypothetical protein